MDDCDSENEQEASEFLSVNSLFRLCKRNEGSNHKHGLENLKKPEDCLDERSHVGREEEEGGVIDPPLMRVSDLVALRKEWEEEAFLFVERKLREKFEGFMEECKEVFRSSTRARVEGLSSCGDNDVVDLEVCLVGKGNKETDERRVLYKRKVNGYFLSEKRASPEVKMKEASPSLSPKRKRLKTSSLEDATAATKRPGSPHVGGHASVVPREDAAETVNSKGKDLEKGGLKGGNLVAGVFGGMTAEEEEDGVVRCKEAKGAMRFVNVEKGDDHYECILASTDGNARLDDVIADHAINTPNAVFVALTKTMDSRELFDTGCRLFWGVCSKPGGVAPPRNRREGLILIIQAAGNFFWNAIAFLGLLGIVLRSRHESQDLAVDIGDDLKGDITKYGDVWMRKVNNEDCGACGFYDHFAKHIVFPPAVNFAKEHGNSRLCVEHEQERMMARFKFMHLREMFPSRSTSSFFSCGEGEPLNDGDIYMCKLSDFCGNFNNDIFPKEVNLMRAVGAIFITRPLIDKHSLTQYKSGEFDGDESRGTYWVLDSSQPSQEGIELPESLCSLPILEHVLIEDTALWGGSFTVLSNCHHLTELRLVKCNLQNLDRLNLSDLRHLKYLDLRYNYLKEMPSRHCSNVKVLDVSHNFLRNASWLDSFNKLTHVDLSYNYIEDDVCIWESLEMIQCSHNKITSLLFKPRVGTIRSSTKVIDCSYNLICEFPWESLEMLEFLNIRSNSVRNISAFVFPPRLKFLSLEDNSVPISLSSTNFERCSSLSVLNMQNCRLSSIPEEMWKLPELDTVLFSVYSGDSCDFPATFSDSLTGIFVHVESPYPNDLDDGKKFEEKLSVFRNKGVRVVMMKNDNCIYETQAYFKASTKKEMVSFLDEQYESRKSKPATDKAALGNQVIGQ